VRLQRRGEIGEDLALDVFLQVADSIADPGARSVSPPEMRDRLAACRRSCRGDLPGHVAVDGGEPRLDAVREVIEATS
jgi:hypothetical protein